MIKEKITHLPNNFLAEQAILNIILTNPIDFKIILTTLKANNFYYESHQLIFEVIKTLIENNQKVNITTVITKLQDNGLLKKIGGIQSIIKILNRYEPSGNLEEYIQMVNEKYFRRCIIELGKKIVSWGYLFSLNSEEIMEKIEKSLFQLNQEKKTQKLYTSAEILDEIFQEIKQKVEKNITTGFLTSFKDLDSIIQGFQKSDLIIIAGRPSMGKTAFSLNIANNIINQYKIPLIIFTLEMSRQQILYRFLASDSGINTNRIKSGKMTQIEWQKLSLSMNRLSHLPIYIDDNPNITLTEIKSKLSTIVNETSKNALVIIDYLQLMKSNVKLENRVQEISYITRNLKMLAKEYQIPILLLSQLSRNVESRINKRPMLSDLRESGCIAPLIQNFQNSYSLDTQKITKSWEKNKIILQSFLPLSLKGFKPSFLIEFGYDKKLIVTANHKILTKTGWTRVSEINLKTKIYSFLNFSSQKQQEVYHYQKLKKISYLGLKKVYDKTINYYHNYSIENIIIHNSIEQDADVVIMIYKEDYYTQKINYQASLNITEFIVAKHRNGPVGIAKLQFNPSITNFSNI
jgi:replicative DNA helicase